MHGDDCAHNTREFIVQIDNLNGVIAQNIVSAFCRVHEFIEFNRKSTNWRRHLRNPKIMEFVEVFLNGESVLF